MALLVLAGCLQQLTEQQLAGCVFGIDLQRLLTGVDGGGRLPALQRQCTAQVMSPDMVGRERGKGFDLARGEIGFTLLKEGAAAPDRCRQAEGIQADGRAVGSLGQGRLVGGQLQIAFQEPVVDFARRLAEREG